MGRRIDLLRSPQGDDSRPAYHRPGHCHGGTNRLPVVPHLAPQGQHRQGIRNRSIRAGVDLRWNVLRQDDDHDQISCRRRSITRLQLELVDAGLAECCRCRQRTPIGEGHDPRPRDDTPRLHEGSPCRKAIILHVTTECRRGCWERHNLVGSSIYLGRLISRC